MQGSPEILDMNLEAVEHVVEHEGQWEIVHNNITGIGSYFQVSCTCNSGELTCRVPQQVLSLVSHSAETRTVALAVKGNDVSYRTFWNKTKRCEIRKVPANTYFRALQCEPSIFLEPFCGHN